VGTGKISQIPDGAWQVQILWVQARADKKIQSAQDSTYYPPSNHFGQT